MNRVVIAISVLFGFVQPVHGQQRPASREVECAVAIEIARTGNSSRYSRQLSGYPNEYKLAWAHGRAATCGAAGGAALAHRIRMERMTADTALLSAYTTGTRGLQDGGVFEAAKSVAQDPSAHPVARIYAFRTLMWIVDGSLFPQYGDLSNPATGICVRHSSFDWDELHGSPVPADMRARIVALARRVLQDPHTAPGVRKAAACAERTATRAGTRPR